MQECPQKYPHITIIGLGAIGTLVAAGLLEKKIDVTYLDSRSAHQASKELLLKIPQNEGVADVAFSDGNIIKNIHISEALDRSTNLYILTLKSYQNAEALKVLAPKIIPHIPLVILQNGMGNQETIAKILPNNPTVIAITAAGATREGNLVTYTSAGVVYYDRKYDLSHLNSNLLPWQPHPDIQKLQLQKLAVNAVINPLSAMFDLRNGELISYRKVIKEMLAEIYNVLIHKDSTLNLADIEKYTFDVILKTSNNISSMLSDIKHNRPTEVESILGYLLQQAEIHHVKVNLLNDLYVKIKKLEKTDDKSTYRRRQWM